MKKILLFFSLVGVLIIHNLAAQNSIVSNDKKYYDNMFNKGLKAYIYRDFQKATLIWKQLLLENPNYTKAKLYFEKAFTKYTIMQKNFYEGLKWFDKKEYRKAIKYFKRTLFINPRHKDAIFYLKLCYEKLRVHLKITDGTNENANEIKDINMTTDDVLELYTIGFDGDNRYVGPVDVKWKSTGTLDPINNTNLTYHISFAPSTPDTSGKIKVTFGNSYPDETGVIKVSQGALSYVKIYSQPGKKGYIVTNINISCDSNILLYAAGFDKKGKYIGDVPLKWQIKVDDFVVEEKDTSVFNFYSHKSGKGYLKAIAKNGFVVTISNIYVKPGKLNFIQIEKSPDGEGTAVGDITITVNDILPLYAVGYDKYWNFIGTIPVDWSSSGYLQKIDKKNRRTLLFKPNSPNVFGRIIIKKGNLKNSTGIIKVIPGATEYIIVTTNRKPVYKKYNKLSVTAGKKINLYASGFDSKKNFVKLFNVNWNIKINDKKQKINYKKEINLIFTNTSDNVYISLSYPDKNIKVQKNLKLIIIPSNIVDVAISDKENEISFSQEYIIKADSNKTFYAYFVDKFGNIVKKGKVKWKLENVNGKLKNNSDSQVTFLPDKVSMGKLIVTTFISNNSFTKSVNIRVVPASPDHILFSKNNNLLINNSSFTDIMYNSILLNSFLSDKKNNIITNIKGEWELFYNHNIKTYSNVSLIKLTFTNQVTNGKIKFLSKEFALSNSLNFIIKYPEIAKVKILNFTNNLILSNIILKYGRNLKVKSIAFDSSNRILYPVTVFWKSKDNDILKYKYGITNVITGNKGGLETTIILSNKIIGAREVAKLKILSPQIVVEEIPVKIESKKVVIYNIYIGDTLGKIVSRLLKIPYKWKYVYPYIEAIADYNKIKDMNLIFPREKLYIPYFNVDNNIKKEDLALKLFNDKRKSNLIIIFNKEKDLITPEDKVIIKDPRFIRSGKLEFILKKKKIVK